MIAYELYCFDKTAEAHFIGILREKKRKREDFYGNSYSDKTTVLVMSATELPFWSTP